MKKILVTAVSAAVVFALSGCGSYSSEPADPDKPLNASETGFIEQPIQLTESMQVLCLQYGSAKRAVISCYEPSEPLQNAVSPQEAGYSVYYYETSLGDTLACLESRLDSQYAELACVELVR